MVPAEVKVSDSDASVIAPFSVRSPFDTHPRSVLIVDDEPHICRTIERQLRLAGLNVTTETSPQRALEMLAGGGHQVIVSDLNMPGGMDGIEFLGEARRRFPRVQRILLSGTLLTLEHMEQAINTAGVHRFMTKPWSNTALLQTIEDCFDQWELVEQRDMLTAELEALCVELEDRVAERTQMLEVATRAWRKTFDTIADPVVLVDHNFQIHRANLAAAAMAAVDIRALNGRQCHESLFGRTSPCDGCPLASNFAGEPVEGPVELAPDADGRVWRVNAWDSTVGESGYGGQSTHVCHYHDVTESKSLQDELVRQQKLAAIGVLAGRVAHELNNPLTGILTFSQLMRSMPGEAKQIMEFGGEIETAARRCKRIIETLLDFARGRSEPGVRALLDLDDLLRTCVDMARIAQEADGVTFEIDLDSDVAPLHAKEDALKSVFINLVQNAIQALDGRGTIRVAAANIPEEGEVEVRIEDDGPGVPDDLKPRIFQEFFTTKADNKEGTGLGLSIVQKAVDDHGGTIEVRDRPGGGASFVVRLPAFATGEEEP
jgi:two-component system NtrC family sensor kinase